MVEYSGISNPGWTFTEKRMFQIAEMFKFIEEKNPDEEFNYIKFQQELEKASEMLDGSKIRMFYPWFTRFGLFYCTKTVKVYGDLCTNLGKQFGKFVLFYLEFNNKIEECDDKQIEAVNNMYRAFMFEFFKNVCKSDRKEIYVELKKWVGEFNVLSKEEFFLLTTKVKYQYSDEWFREQIRSYRNHEFSFDIMTIKKDRNAFGYIVPFCVEAGIVRWSQRDNQITPARDINFEGEIEDGI